METWADSDEEFKNCFPGFNVFTKHRPRKSARGRFVGGVCILVRENISRMIKPVDSNLKDCIFILIDGNLVGNIRDILLCGVYIPPEHSTFYNDLNSDNGVELFEGQLVEVISKFYLYHDVDAIVTSTHALVVNLIISLTTIPSM